MSRQNITKTIKEFCEPIIEENGFDLVDLEYVRESGNRFLRFYIGKAGGIGVDDCQKVSEIISKKLDELDLIQESYYLEVSSPGLNRPLKTDRDLKRTIGTNVDVKLYKAIDGIKQYTGKLIDYTPKYILIEEDNHFKRELDRKYISQIKQTVKF